MMTTHPHFSLHADEPALRLVSALHALRDALVQMSICMQDLKFEVDVEGHKAAAEIFEELTEKTKRLSE